MDKTLVNPETYAHCFSMENYQGPEYASNLVEHLIAFPEQKFKPACGDEHHIYCHSRENCPGHYDCRWHNWYYCDAVRGWCDLHKSMSNTGNEEGMGSGYCSDCVEVCIGDVCWGTDLCNLTVGPSFESDAKMRNTLFAEGSGGHIAPYNLNMMLAVLKHIVKPGEVCMDIMSGTGSLMLATLPPVSADHVYLLELQDSFHQLQLQSAARMQIQDKVTSMKGDCAKLLNLFENQVDHIIFSPPYAGVLNTDKAKAKTAGHQRLVKGWDEEATRQYSEGGKANVGNLNDFDYTRAMGKIYSQCFKALKPGGQLTIIIKDRTVKQERHRLSMRAHNKCVQAGFEKQAWYKWAAPGTAFVPMRRKRGEHVILDEDIIVMRKP